jgi:hypothetical protein
MSVCRECTGPLDFALACAKYGEWAHGSRGMSGEAVKQDHFVDADEVEVAKGSAGRAHADRHEPANRGPTIRPGGLHRFRRIRAPVYR